MFLAVGEGSAIESIALKAVFVVSALLLQKPFRTSKNPELGTAFEIMKRGKSSLFN